MKELSDDVNSIISNGGNSFSNGQKQKIAIAWTLYNNPAIFLFDESTSAFDKIEEKNFYKNFKDIVGNKTNIHIAHKISPMIDSD